METSTIKTLFLSLICLLYAQFGQAQITDWDLFNPLDDEGNFWYETKADREDFFNYLVETVQVIHGDGLISLRDDVFAVSIRTDDDYVYDNKNYYHFVMPRNASGYVSFYDFNSTTALNDYSFHFYIGTNMQSAEITIVEDVLSGFWGEQLVESNETTELTGVEVGDTRNLWLEYPTPVMGVLKNVIIKGY